MISHLVHMAAMGLLVSVVAPALLMAINRTARGLDRWSAPAWLALPLFVVLHGAVTVYTAHGSVPPLLDAAAHLALLVGALLFWAPVVGIRHRLPDGLRAVYLYIAMPMLDLAGLWLIALGHSAGGLAMIVGMLPMGLVAVIITWRWIGEEERHAVVEETSPGAASAETSSGTRS